MPSDHKVKSIALEPPDYEGTARFLAEGLRTHSFNYGAAAPVVSFIEHIRYLDRKSPDEVEKLLNELRSK